MRRELTEHIQLWNKRGLTSVYTEKSIPENNIRIWLSFDIDNDDENQTRHKKLYDWLCKKNAEAWGNSIATFLVEWKENRTPQNQDIRKILVNELTKADGILRGKNYDDPAWKESIDISLYVNYKYAVKVNNYIQKGSNYFALIQNANLPFHTGYPQLPSTN